MAGWILHSLLFNEIFIKSSYVPGIGGWDANDEQDTVSALKEPTVLWRR